MRSTAGQAGPEMTVDTQENIPVLSMREQALQSARGASTAGNGELPEPHWEHPHLSSDGSRKHGSSRKQKSLLSA
eukprot:1142195-Pelagomonas_calceolata.AAC.3